MIILFDHIRKYHPDYNHSKLEKEQLQKALGKALPLNTKYVNSRISQLSLLVEEFLIVQQSRTNISIRRKALHQAFVQHNHFDLFKKSTEKEIERLKKKSEYGWSYHMELWELLHELFIHPQTEKWNPKKDGSIEMMAQFDEAYLILKLRYGFSQKIRDSIFQSDQITIILDEIIAQCKGHQNPVIQMYLLLIESFDNPNPEKHWHKTFDFYKKKFNLLPREERQVGLISLITRGKKIVLQGQSGFQESVLNLYKFGLKKDLLIQNGQIAEISFQSIALFGASTGKIKWAASFMKNYEKYLPKNYDKNILYISNAYLAFCDNKFKKCKEWLDKSEHLNTKNSFNYRSLYTRCLYELHIANKDSSSLLITHLDTYARFLQHKKKEVTKDTIKAYQNFIFLIKKMVEARQLPLRERNSRIEKIRKEMEKRKSNIALAWIEKKLDALKTL